VQRAEIVSAIDFAFGQAGSLESGLGGDGDEGIELRVELFDAIEAFVGELDGRDGAVANFWA